GGGGGERGLGIQGVDSRADHHRHNNNNNDNDNNGDESQSSLLDDSLRKGSDATTGAPESVVEGSTRDRDPDAPLPLSLNISQEDPRHSLAASLGLGT
ncbi:hypothetical protein LTS18_014600, partial [Coniosporium uncinatum]